MILSYPIKIKIKNTIINKKNTKIKKIHLEIQKIYLEMQNNNHIRLLLDVHKKFVDLHIKVKMR
jgi:hypothetical protein